MELYSARHFFILLIVGLIAAHVNTSICISSASQNDCSRGEALTRFGGLAGRCPGCEGGLGFNIQCRNSQIPCAPGLACFENFTRCQYDLESCWYTRHLANTITLLPTCDLDGHFAPVQCKGDKITGRCFCSSETGEQIFGWDWWKDANDMTCACSRLRSNLERSGQHNAFLHCQRNGNFEELQCSTEICWCADPKTGMRQQNNVVVPRSWWKLLPCC